MLEVLSLLSDEQSSYDKYIVQVLRSHLEKEQIMPRRNLVTLSVGILLFAAAAIWIHADRAGSAEPSQKAKPVRYGSVIQVKAEKLDYYKQLHANPWPAVNAAIKKANIRDYSIYLTQFDDGKWYLFSQFEYVGTDFEGDMKEMAENPEVVRWWKETDPCQIPFENRAEGDWWKSMEEVYRLD